jgi:hypothetical protein
MNCFKCLEYYSRLKIFEKNSYCGDCFKNELSIRNKYECVSCNQVISKSYIKKHLLTQKHIKNSPKIPKPKLIEHIEIDLNIKPALKVDIKLLENTQKFGVEKSVEMMSFMFDKLAKSFSILSRYKLVFSKRMTRTWGYCQTSNLDKHCVIKISITRDRTIGAYLNTLTHEIAHVITFGDHHGKKWKACHISLGGDGKRCSES